MNWLLKWLLARLGTAGRIKLAYGIVRDEVIGNVDAERFITEIVKDSKNRVISFKIKD